MQTSARGARLGFENASVASAAETHTPASTISTVTGAPGGFGSR